jgi:hypothetical protein
MIRCRATGQEGDCDGMAQSSMYRVPADTPEPGWEWFKPCGSEYRKLSRQMRDHVDKGGLDIRRKRGYVNPAPQTPSPTEQPIPRYDYASGKVEYVLRGLFYDSREEALACNKQRMPQMSGRREE